MESKNQSPILTNSNPQASKQVRVKFDGIPDGDVSKLRGILKLSHSRDRQYVEVDSEAATADLIITSQPDKFAAMNPVIIGYGSRLTGTDCQYKLQPPLLSIRVLRLLDGIDVDCSNLSQKQEQETTLNSANLNASAASLNDEQQQNTQHVPAPKATPSESITTNQTYRVLIVDDSQLIHKALDIELSKAPFISDKDYALSGEDCLDLVSKHQYDIIFLDVMMPGIDGIETCTEIRKLTHYKKVPIIMLSAKTSPLDEVKGVMAGCTTYLTKPIKHDDFQKLLNRMGNWLENYKAN